MKKPTLQERKTKAIEIMKKMEIYQPYIEEFDKNNQITYFERGMGYWVNADSELYQRIKKIEEKYDLTVYAAQYGPCLRRNQHRNERTFLANRIRAFAIRVLRRRTFHRCGLGRFG